MTISISPMAVRGDIVYGSGFSYSSDRTVLTLQSVPAKDALSTQATEIISALKTDVDTLKQQVSFTVTQVEALSTPMGQLTLRLEAVECTPAHYQRALLPLQLRAEKCES